MKFLKYSWGFNEDGTEKYAIVQEIDQFGKDATIVREKLMEAGMDVEADAKFAKMIYGSRAKYSKRGQILLFNEVVDVTPLAVEDVINEHFVGLI